MALPCWHPGDLPGRRSGCRSLEKEKENHKMTQPGCGIYWEPALHLLIIANEVEF